MRTLFDIDALIALFDPEHINHDRAHGWWEANRSGGWASCPTTQIGFVRVLSAADHPKAMPVQAALGLLRSATAQRDHAFWGDDISLLDPQRLDLARVLVPKQLTGAYLLALATRNGGRLATCDRSLPLAAAGSAEPRNLVVL
jgi:toxin-antitoxin system PIN domain toxin